MKKLFALSAIALSASVFAQTASIKLDAQKFNGTEVTNSEVMIGIKSDKVWGFGFEGYVVSDSLRGGISNAQSTGYEVATSYQTPSILGVVPHARLGYGYKSTSGGRDVSYWSVSADGRIPTGSNLTYVVGYEHRIGVNTGDLFRSNQISAGAEYSLTKRFSVEGRLSHTVGDGYFSNGLIGDVSYSF